MLEKAGLVLKAKRTAANGIPLGAEADDDCYKAMIADLGLHQRLLGLDLREGIVMDHAEFVNRGALAEVYAGLQIAAHSSMRHRPELYYWHREAPSATAEVDYVLQRGLERVPVVVKAGVRGTMKSLRMFLAEKRAGRGVRLSLENFAALPDVDVMPLYAVHRVIARQG